MAESAWVASAAIVARTLPVELHVTMQRAQGVVESAIYFTVAEALTNVAKHASATCATVDVEVRDDELVAVINDDGR